MSFTCEGAILAGSLDEGPKDVGLLIVGGGTQTRIGSHRVFERLAHNLAAEGYPVFRFDRRGVGDSEGEDPGFRDTGPDLVAAAAAFRSIRPGLRKLIGFGLCDGATALALAGREAGIDSIVMANPWFVEAGADAPPPAAIKQHYRQRLLSLDGWKSLLSGRVSYRKLFAGLMKIAKPAPTGLAAETAASLQASGAEVALILCRGDATAIAAADAWQRPEFAGVRNRAAPPAFIDSDAHTFSRPGDMEALESACLELLRRFE